MLQQKNFGSPNTIISDRGTAFTSQEFRDYCAENDINHVLITTGLPRSNGQIERINSIVISVLTKISLKDPQKWYKHVDHVQQVINSTYQRSIKTEPFKLMFGVPMKNKEDLRIREIIEDEILEEFDERREELRQQAKQQIEKIQNENRKTYNLRRRPSRQYNLNDLVAIKRTQVGPGSKLKPKYLGPYKISRIKGKNSYDVEKVGFHEGPMRTSSCTEFMKPWSQHLDDPSFFDIESPETSDPQDGRVVGNYKLPPPLAKARRTRGGEGDAGRDGVNNEVRERDRDSE